MELARSGETDFRLLAEAMPQIVWITRADGWNIYFNRQWTEYTGLTLEESYGHGWNKPFHPDDRQRAWDAWQNAVMNNATYSLECRLRRADGSYRWWLIRGVPISDENGKILKWFGTCTDIEDIKQSEEALRRSEERYHGLFDAMIEGFCKIEMIFAADGTPVDYRYLASNPAFEKQTGLHDVQGRLRSDVAQAPASHWLEVFGKVALTGEPVRFEEESRALGRYYDVCAFRIGGPESRKVAILFNDISKRKQAEKTVAMQAAELDMLYATAPVGLFFFDSDLRFVRVNNAMAELNGLPPEQHIGRTLRELLTDELADAVEPLLRQVMQTGQPLLDLEVHGATAPRPREQREWLVSYYPVRDQEGAIRGVHGVVQEITQRKLAEKEIQRLNADLTAHAVELEAANRELEAFSHTVAHDLRKPLTIVSGYCQAIQEFCGDSLDEQCRGFIQEAYDGTFRMNRLIDTLLQFSEGAHAEPKIECVELSAMGKEIAAELKMAEPERQVTFHIPDRLEADGDPNLLRVVLSNLFGNAWKYTSNRQEAVIEFGAGESGGRRVYFVRDNGIGFDPEQAETLFTPFQRGHSGKEIGGLGIGLATVDRIIKRHGGKVWAEGEPGKGATFFFTLG